MDWSKSSPIEGLPELKLFHRFSWCCNWLRSPLYVGCKSMCQLMEFSQEHQVLIISVQKHTVSWPWTTPDGDTPRHSTTATKALPKFIHQILSPETQLQQPQSDRTNTHGSTSLHTTCYWNHKPHSTWVQCQHQPQTTIILTSTTVKAEGPREQIWQKWRHL